MADGWKRVRATWPHVRAALVALHLIAVVLMALPSPGGRQLTPRTWADPTVQAEVAAWGERLRRLGWSGTNDALSARAYQAGRTLAETRRWLLAPFQPYSRELGTEQAWQMFVAPHVFPTRFAVDIEDERGWRPVYLERSPEQTWQRGLLDHHRMRSAIFRFAWPTHRYGYVQWVDFLAGRAREDFPTAVRLRAQFYRQQTPRPSALRAGKVEAPRPESVELRDWRPPHP